MAEHCNSDVVTVTKDLVEPSSRIDASKTAAQNQYAMWFHTERLSTETIPAATHFKFGAKACRVTVHCKMNQEKCNAVT
jgi:hypothetical protein